MKKNRFIAMVLGAALLMAQFSSAIVVHGEEEEKYKIWVSDSTDRDFSYDPDTNPEDNKIEFGESESKDFNDSNGNIPVLQGNPYLDVDIVVNEKIDKIEYEFTKVNEAGSTEPVDGYSGEIDVDAKEKLYPDIEKAKRGFMTAQHYDVSHLTAMNNNQWSIRSNVFFKKSGPIVYKSAETSTKFSSETTTKDFYVYRTRNTSTKTFSYSTNTVFYEFQLTDETVDVTENKKKVTYKGSLTEASKFWGYIKFPDVTEKNKTVEYYIGVVVDDGCNITILDDRGDDSPNGGISKDNNEFIVIQQFVPQAVKLNTKNIPFKVTSEDNGRYFPIYIEYFNYGGAGELMLVYDTEKFINPTSVSYDNSKKLSTVKSELNKNNVRLIPSDWFYPSKSTKPAAPEAVFQSTAQDGVEFPTEDGIYYVTITETLKNEDGTTTTRTLTLGPFEINNTQPDGIIERTPDMFTKDKIDINMLLTQYPPNATVTIKELVHIDNNGTETILKNNFTPNLTVAQSADQKYTVQHNGKYKYVYYLNNTSEEHSIEGTVMLIDRHPPEVELSLTAIEGVSDKATLKIGAKDVIGGTDIPTGYLPYIASGFISIAGIKYTEEGNSNEETVTLSSVGLNTNSFPISANWEFAATKGRTYFITIKDLLGNETVKSIDVNAANIEIEEPPINDLLVGTLMNLDFATVDKERSLYKGEDGIERLNLVEEGRFQAVLTIDLNNNGLLTKLKEAMGSMITVNFSSKVDEVETAPNFKIIRIQSADKYQWITVNSDKKSMRISIDNYNDSINSLVLFFDIGDIREGSDVGAEPTISIGDIEVVFDGATYNAENGEQSEQGELNLRIINKPKIN